MLSSWCIIQLLYYSIQFNLLVAWRWLILKYRFQVFEYFLISIFFFFLWNFEICFTWLCYHILTTIYKFSYPFCLVKTMCHQTYQTWLFYRILCLAVNKTTQVVKVSSCSSNVTPKTTYIIVNTDRERFFFFLHSDHFSFRYFTFCW